VPSGTGTDDLVATVAARLRAANIPLRSGEQPDWDREARVLVSRASDEDPTRSVETLLAYRLDGIPLGYLAGSELFLGDEFEVEAGLVIPHPATELLALLAVAAVDRHATHTATPKLLEVGVGVGVVAVSALKRRAEMQAHCSELSGAALRLTRENAERLLGGTRNLYLYQAYVTDDIFSAFLPRPVTGVNVVVSNPPYLVEGDEVSEATKKSGVAHFSYAPENDPSWFLRRVVSAPDGLLSQDCSVLMECAEWYVEEHEEVMRDAGWQTEAYDREEYIAQFGAPPELRPMTPTAHRVMHAWRGAGGPLKG
jgi:HemK-like putative methylase